MATLSSWTNDGLRLFLERGSHWPRVVCGAGAIGLGLSAARYALRHRLSAARYHIALCPLASRYALWLWYDVPRSTFLAEEGAAVLAGPSPLPYSRDIDYIYLKTINT